jgi:hypothetical protein
MTDSARKLGVFTVKKGTLTAALEKADLPAAAAALRHDVVFHSPILEPLLARIEEALRRAGLGHRSLGWADLVPLDQFHVRGLCATRELAESLGIGVAANVLDVGRGLGGP